jgi:hypothetical protein
MWSLAMKSWKISEMATGLLPFPIYPVKIAALLGLSTATIEASRRLIIVLMEALHPIRKDKP